MSNNLNKKIKEIREDMNLSQSRFGMKVGVSGKTISAYETGRAVPSLKVLEKIEGVYNVSFAGLSNTSSIKIKEKIKSIEDSIGEIKDFLKLSL